MVQLKEHAESENINLKKDFENLEKEFFEIQNIFESQKAEQDDDKKRFDDEISHAGGDGEAHELDGILVC